MISLKELVDQSKASGLNYKVVRNWIQPTPLWSEFRSLYAYSSGGRVSIKGEPITEKMQYFLDQAIAAYPDIDYEFFAMGAESFRRIDPDNSGTYQHTDPHDVIHWQCRGASEWFMGDDMKPVLLEPGDLIWFAANTKHKIENLTEKMSLIFNAGKLF
jgi:mannose-6-phosphate isomerase-like protein (cupin superfamily)